MNASLVMNREAFSKTVSHVFDGHKSEWPQNGLSTQYHELDFLMRHGNGYKSINATNNQSKEAQKAAKL